jgi:heat shock protein HslJ
MLPSYSSAAELRRLPALWLLPALAAGLLTITSACASGGAGEHKPPLRGTTWVLVGDGGQKIARPPSIVLDPDQPRVNGFAGCNRLMGSFELDAARLRFGSAATTRMACLDGGDVEERFLQAYAAVRGWRIAGGELLLTGADGRTLLRLQPGAATQVR